MPQEKFINRMLTVLFLGIIIASILFNLSEMKLTVYRMKSKIELTSKK